MQKATKVNKFIIKLFTFIVGKAYYTGMQYNYSNHIKNLGLDGFDIIFLERFFSYYLFNKASNALFFYDGTDNILSTLKFKHSINLEYVFGLFPTVIIGFIIVPSMYLLYSNETDINPCITVKIIGHQ
jgi:hypothetical protein